MESRGLGDVYKRQPPTAPEPYNVAADPPLIISILSILSVGICELMVDISISLRRLPFIKIKVFDFATSPKPRISNVVYTPSYPAAVDLVEIPE